MTAMRHLMMPLYYDDDSFRRLRRDAYAAAAGHGDQGTRYAASMRRAFYRRFRAENRN